MQFPLPVPPGYLMHSIVFTSVTRLTESTNIHWVSSMPLALLKSLGTQQWANQTKQRLTITINIINNKWCHMTEGNECYGENEKVEQGKGWPCWWSSWDRGLGSVIFTLLEGEAWGRTRVQESTEPLGQRSVCRRSSRTGRQQCGWSRALKGETHQRPDPVGLLSHCENVGFVWVRREPPECWKQKMPSSTRLVDGISHRSSLPQAMLAILKFSFEFSSL